MAATRKIVIDLTRDDEISSPVPEDGVYETAFICDTCFLTDKWCVGCRKRASKFSFRERPLWLNRKIEEWGIPPSPSPSEIDEDENNFSLPPKTYPKPSRSFSFAGSAAAAAAAGAPVIVPAPAVVLPPPPPPPRVRSAIPIAPIVFGGAHGRAPSWSLMKKLNMSKQQLVGERVKGVPSARARRTADREVVAQARRRSGRVPSHVSSVAVVQKGGHRFPLRP